ncbi:MAG TPA: glycosyltransferase family 4 protein [Nitrososphaerales archaeon]|nr:glycosyltransferase family 4 protein [Nitrososphaerales archaeon]
MKVLFISDVAYPWTKGGSEYRIFKMADHLVKKGHSATVLCGKWWSGTPAPKGVIGVPIWKQLYAGRRRSVLSGASFALSAARRLPELGNYDLVEFNQSPVTHFALLDARPFARAFRRASLVGMLHEVWKEYWFSYAGLSGGVGYFLERRGATALDHIITISDFTRKRLLELSVRGSDITIIRPGIDYEEIVTASPSKERYDIVFVGRLVSDAHLERLVQTVRILKDKHNRKTRLLVVGGGPMLDSLVGLSRAMGVSDDVFFRGVVQDRREVYSLLRGAKVYVLPSAPHGGWNMASVEGNAAGLPIVAPIASEIGWAAELIDEARNGMMVEDATPEKLAQAILYLLENESDLQRMSRESVLRAKQFDWELVCGRTVGLYESLLRN